MIACEGEKTETIYFNNLFDELKSSNIISKRSCVFAPHRHTNPLGVLQDLIDCNYNGNTYQDFDYKWIVIDRDEERTNGGGHTKQDFSSAIERARELNISVAWSNPSFEIWYLLHYQYRDTGIHRDEVIKRLGACLNRKYEKNDGGIFVELVDKRFTAVRNAKRLYREKVEEMGLTPADANPCTTVYKLIEELLNAS